MVTAKFVFLERLVGFEAGLRVLHTHREATETPAPRALYPPYALTSLHWKPASILLRVPRDRGQFQTSGSLADLLAGPDVFNPVKCFGRSSALAHAVAGKSQSVGVVNEPAEDGIGEVGVAYSLMPVCDRKLAVMILQPLKRDMSERSYGDIQIYEMSPWLDRFPGSARRVRTMGHLRDEERTAMSVLLGHGHSQSAVARLLGLSDGTARYHRKRMGQAPPRAACRGWAL